MLNRLRDWWSDYCGVVILIALVLLVVGPIAGLWYTSNHQTYKIDEGIRVHVIGRMWYQKEFKDYGRKNQFFASNEMGYSGMTMEPIFQVENVSDRPRDVRIDSLSRWRTPIAGTVYLAPGQKFMFSLSSVPGSKHWYCWINPLEQKQISKAY